VQAEVEQIEDGVLLRQHHTRRKLRPGCPRSDLARAARDRGHRSPAAAGAPWLRAPSHSKRRRPAQRRPHTRQQIGNDYGPKNPAPVPL